MSSTSLQTFHLEALHSRSSIECQSSPCSLVWHVKPTNRKSWAGNLLMHSDLIFGPSFKVKQGQPKLKVLITHLLLVVEVCSVNQLKKSWAGNLVINVKVLITHFLLVLEVCNVKPTCRKSWCGQI